MNEPVNRRLPEQVRSPFGLGGRSLRPRLAVLVGLLVLTPLLMGGVGIIAGPSLCKPMSLCSWIVYLLTRKDIEPRARLSDVQPELAEVYLDIAMTGVYSPSLVLDSSALPTDEDEELPLPGYLDELAANGFLAIRLPHAPPDFGPSSLLPGLPPYDPDALSFRYYSPPDAAQPTTVPLGIERRTSREAEVNVRYPILDGQSHWEVWWLEEERFPIPEGSFRLKEEWPQAIEVAFRIDFGEGAEAAAASGKMIEVLLFNGYSYIGPFRVPLVFKTQEEGLWPEGNPSATFDMCNLFASRLEYVQPGVPFTHTHWLTNFEPAARSFTITASSSQDWDYAYYYGVEGGPLHQAAGLPFTVEAPAAPADSYPYESCLGIYAVTTPGFAEDASLRETLYLTATAVSDTGLRFDTLSMALSPNYQLDEGSPGYRVLLPYLKGQ